MGKQLRFKYSMEFIPNKDITTMKEFPFICEWETPRLNEGTIMSVPVTRQMKNLLEVALLIGRRKQLLLIQQALGLNKDTIVNDIREPV
jgi:hypothetical protein